MDFDRYAQPSCVLGNTIINLCTHNGPNIPPTIDPVNVSLGVINGCLIIDFKSPRREKVLTSGSPVNLTNGSKVL
jgi:hypothetical protein